MVRPNPALFLMSLALAGTVSAVPLGGQEAVPDHRDADAADSLRAYRIPSTPDDGARKIRLDGLLNEPHWARAAPAGGFRQREPDAGEPASERTEVRVVYDDETLYVGVRALDSRPERIASRTLQRDRLMEADFGGRSPTFVGDDAIALLFDPFHEHRRGVVLATNPNGAEFDALMTDEGRDFNVDWRGVWQVEAQRTEDGWSAEFAIPFRSLRYPDETEGRPWGFNAFRIVQRTKEQVLWRSWTREGGGFQRIDQAGHLVGLSDLPRQRLNVEAKPYGLAGVTQTRTETGALPTERTGELGLDLKAEPRPGLVLDLTYNTDFAQVEVDEVQVNLTRFSLFFPEKRDFFLENAGVFRFGQDGDPLEPPPFLLFFSRRIGIEDGEQVPILGGGRLTGRLGEQTVGFMNVTTDPAPGAPRTNYSVARLKRDVGSNGYVGGMLTERRASGETNTAGGADASYWFNERLNFQGFLAGSRTSGAGGDGHAYRGALRYDADRIGFELQHLTVSPEMTARSGFITRKGYRRIDGFFRVTPRPDVLGLRKIDIFTGVDVSLDMDGSVLDRRGGNFFSTTWESGEELTVFGNLAELTVEEDFRLADSLAVGAGRYASSFAGWFFNTSRSRPVVLESRARFEKAFGGRQYSVGGTLTVQPTRRLSLSAGYTRNDVDIPSGDFIADISSLRADVAFTTDFSTNLLVQYNSLTREIITNLRVNFIHRPGSDLFVVLTEERGSPTDVWRLRDRGLVAKLTYLLRF